jgi:hypothetical protein
VTGERQTNEVRVGCAGLPSGVTRDVVFEAVPVLEDNSLNREPAPGPKALRRWRREAPDGAGFTLTAPTGVFAADGAAALDQFVEAVVALAPEAVLLQPPLDCAPSESNRERLRSLARVELSGNPPRVLVPTGLWDPEICLALAEELDLLVAIDPLASDVQDRQQPLWAHQLGRGIAYLRIERLASTRRRLDDYELETDFVMAVGCASSSKTPTERQSSKVAIGFGNSAGGR